jgi:hypothetical protein
MHDIRNIIITPEILKLIADVDEFKGRWKVMGPDNLWAVRDKEHVLIECKSEVDLRRTEIGKANRGK